MKWEELGPEERYKVVEMALGGKVSYRALCESFGMSRQTLDRAIATARQGATAALVPKGAGRKPMAENEVRVKALNEEKSRAEQERDDWKTKCEVMKTLLNLYRQYDVEIAPTEVKKRTPRSAPQRSLGPEVARTAPGATRVETPDDGRSPRNAARRLAQVGRCV